MLRGCLGGFGALFHDAARARITLAESYLWAACALSYYGISFNSAEVSSDLALELTPLLAPPTARARQRAVALFPSPFRRARSSGSVYTNFVLVSLPLYPVAFVGSRLMDAPCLGRKAPRHYISRLALALGTAALLPQYAIGASMVANFFALAAFNLVYVQAAELSHFGALDGDRLPLSRLRLATLVAIALPTLAGPRMTLAAIAVVDACALPFVALVPETRGVSLTAGWTRDGARQHAACARQGCSVRWV